MTAVRTWSLRRRAAAAGALVLVALGSATAIGYWSGAGQYGGGQGAAGAAAVARGSAPQVEEAGSRNVVVTWGDSGLSNGVPADGYVVRRYDSATGAEGTIASGCSGTITANTCTEPGTPVGGWKYTVTPAFADHWRGDESLKSGAVDTGPGSLVLDRTLFGGTVAPLPATVSGTASSFSPGEAITYKLDDSVPLTGSPPNVGPAGSTALSVTIPAGTSDGPHSVSVLGAGKQASVGILVDNTAPTIVPFTTPAANAAGWNNTSPVEVNGTVDDGNGSGVAYAKYTDDGTDPKTSPTAQFATGPLSVSATTTMKYFIADAAGNQSPVETIQIKIDVTPPYFTVDFVDVEGGVFQGIEVATGLPGVAYYRGADAGSMRFRMTPIPLGGSPSVSAGFSELPADAIGFSFNSSAVTSPAGGPYLSNPISWVAGSTSTPNGTISLTNEAGNTFGSTGALHNDSIAPTGGSVDARGLAGTGGRYSNSRDLELDLAKGTDAASGLADGSGPSDLPARLMRASASLTTSNGTAEGTCGPYGAYAQIGADEPGVTVADTVPTDAACYRYRYLVSDHVGNAAAYTSGDIKVQTSVSPDLRPTNATLTPVSGVSSQYVSAGTVYYNPAQSGSFNVDSSSSSPTSGVAGVQFPAIAGFSGGGTATDPVSGTTYRRTYTWSSNGAAPSPGVQALVASNNAGLTSTNSSAFTVSKDDLGPTGGSVDAIGLGGTGGRYSASLNLNLGFAKGADSGAGLAPTGSRLLRASSSLTADGSGDAICGTFGAFSQAGPIDPASPRADTVPADHACYRYAYAVPDRVGNTTTYTSPDIKVNASPSVPALGFSAFSNSSVSGTGTTVFYRSAAASGGFRVTASSSDASAYAFPVLPAGWSGTSAGFGIQDYSWSAANPGAPSGGQTVTMTSNSGSHATASFTAVADNTAPAGGNVQYTNGYSNGSTVSISFGRGSDGGSGVNASSGILESSTATLSAGACGTFGPFVTAAVNPLSGVSLPVVSGVCYRYRYLASDNVGNQVTYSSPSVAKVDSQGPINATTMVDGVGASMTNNNLYYKGDAAGSFKLVNALTDAASGPASSTFPAINAAGWVHDLETVSTPVGGPYTSSTYSWSANPAVPATTGVNGTDVSGKSATNGSVSFTSDTVAPTGGSILYPNGVVNSASIPVTASTGGDFASGINLATVAIKRDAAFLNTTTETCAAFPGTFATGVTLVAGADTSVTTGNCYRYQYVVSDKVGNQTTYTSASVAKVDTSGPRVTAIVSQQSNGAAGNGRLEVGDRLLLTFNQSLAPASVPASWSGGTESTGLQTSTKLTIPGFTNGSIDTGGDYLPLAMTTATLGGSATLANAGTATLVTLTVTSLSGAATSAGSGSMLFEAARTITDGGGNASAGSFTTSSAFRLF